MLLPINRYTDELWHRAIIRNHETLLLHHKFNYESHLQTMAIRCTGPFANEERHLIIMATDEHKNDKDNPHYFDLALVLIDPLNLPELARNQFPPTTANLFKYGRVGFIGSLSRDSQDGSMWSMQTVKPDGTPSI